MNLLSKLREKFKNVKDETKKRVMSTILAGGIALSGLGLSACNSTTNNNDNTNPPIVNPGDNENENQTPGGDNGNSQTPGEGNGGSQTPDYSKYSQILQNVLTDKYYWGLEGEETADDKIGANRWTYNNPRFMAIPYGFLEDEGFDISKIKSGSLYCKSDLYTINNDLFIELRAEIKTNTPIWENTSSYLANYVLKYTLTNQELKEVLALHEPLSSSDKTTYLQAPFFIQELSYLKTPEIMSKQYITLDSISAAEERCDEKGYVLGVNHLTYLGFTKTDDVYYSTTFQTHIRTTNNSRTNDTKKTSNLYTISFKTMGHGCVEYNNMNIRISTKQTALTLPTENKEAAKASKTPITILSSYASLFKNIKDASIEDVLSK